MLALGSSRSLEQQQQQGRVRQRAGGGGGGGGVGWQQEGVVDLEIEAQLKRLTEVLPDDIRQQVGPSLGSDFAISHLWGSGCSTAWGKLMACINHRRQSSCTLLDSG